MIDNENWVEPANKFEQLSKKLKMVAATVNALANKEQQLKELLEMFEQSDREYFPIEIAGHGIDVTRSLAIAAVQQELKCHQDKLEEMFNQYKDILNDKC